MNHRMFSKFNVYDQTGYLLVGAVGLLVMYLDFLLLHYEFPAWDLGTAVIWLVAAYFLGHVVQAVANVFIREKKEDFDPREKRILETARKFFGVEDISNREVWNLCHMAALAKDATGQISSFNAYYGLYRGWLVVFVLESIFLLIHAIRFLAVPNVLWLVVSASLAFLFYRRSKRFYAYLREKVLQTFLVVRALKL